MIKEAKISSIVSLFPLPQYVVVLEDVEKTRLVPIWIGVNEGNAIALEMQGEKFPRPLTHDLMAGFLQMLGAEIEKVVVNDLKENSYYALIYVKHNGKVTPIDARPSDALALAVRVKCPIYIDEKVLKKCPAIDGQITEGEVEKFKEQLKTLTPEEFFKGLEEGPGEGGDEEESDDDEEGKE
ncbi:MAG: bifunctional nuclease family protein [Candidatus Omnitrophica bacterium]|nr:bifunctional nuclease family protein [Candidatus Omnitrophota bacterium]